MTNEQFKQELTKALFNQNISITADCAEKFLKYKELLIEWNKKINLTAITEDVDVIWKHFVDCAMITEVIRDEDKSLIDVGTGAGFPGLPIKLLCPNVEITLLDSLEKRIKYLNEVINTLELDKIKTIHMRAEDGGRDKTMRECYDYATARAVATLPVLAEYCLPFVKVGGYFIAMKSGKVDEEIMNAKKALDTLGGKIEEVKNVEIDGLDAQRTLIVIKKFRQISPLYPRKAGQPSKRPL